MSWENRIREPAYVSPTGKRFSFEFENVSSEFDKKTAAFNFPDVDGTYVQDLGHTGYRYPLRMFFIGANCDNEADEFEKGVQERGKGKLEHPKYGVVDVLPFGLIKRRDDLKTAANQTVVEVTFWETTDLVYPTSRKDPAQLAIQSVENFNRSAASQFESYSNLRTKKNTSSFLDGYNNLLDWVEGGLDVVASAQDDVRSEFEAINGSIRRGIYTLIDQPLTLAAQTILLIQSPARSASLIQDRLEGYQNLANQIINQSVASNDALHSTDTQSGVSLGELGYYDSSELENQFHLEDLLVSSCMSGAVLSVVNSQFTTRSEAIHAADALLVQLEDIVRWRDERFSSLDIVDVGASYQALQESVAIAAGFLVEISFSLLQERRIVLTRARTMLDIVAELYGVVDEKLDFFINTNNLNGDEYIEIPKGREIVFYVQS